MDTPMPSTEANQKREVQLEIMLLDATMRRNEAMDRFVKLQHFLTGVAGPAFIDGPSDFSRVQTYQNALARTAEAATLCTFTQKNFEEWHTANGLFLSGA
jgi:hypothetical protein